MNESAADGIPVAVRCRVLKLARQPYYRWRANPVTDAVAAEVSESRVSDLLDADHYGVRPRQGVDVASGESDLGHPTPAVCSGEVEPDSLDEHVETHEQTECVLTPIIVDDGLVHDERPTCGQGVESF